MSLEVLDPLEDLLYWWEKRSAGFNAGKFELKSDFSLLSKASVNSRFLLQFLGFWCVFGLWLLVLIFSTTLLWRAWPNSSQNRRYLGWSPLLCFCRKNQSPSSSSQLFSLPAGSFFVFPLRGDSLIPGEQLSCFALGEILSGTESKSRKPEDPKTEHGGAN